MPETVSGKLHNCEVCGLPVLPWGKPTTLQGCHCSIYLVKGKLLTLYFGSVHRECALEDWPRQMDEAVKKGWLIPNPEGEGFVPAPQYR